MTLERLAEEARAAGLALRGALHPGARDNAPEGCLTLLLLGPDEPVFWGHFATSPEYASRRDDPLDRWSKRVIGALADRWQGQAVFPSDGPPYPPFQAWAQASGRSWVSPVGLLVHDVAGLLISYRAAIALPFRLALPATGPAPCSDCTAPCKTACPVGALRPDHVYDVATCQAFLRSDDGLDCRERGCLVRRACPLSETLRRPDEQAAFHMAAFMENWDRPREENRR